MLDTIIRQLDNIIWNAGNSGVTKEMITESLKVIVKDLKKMKGMY